MKRCPTCKRVFEESHLSFCLDDGTPLVAVESPADDSETTLVSPSTRTQKHRPTETNPTGANAGYQPPGSYAAPEKGRPVWPWILAILAGLLLLTIGVGVAAALIVPRMMRQRAASEEPGVNSNRRLDENINQGQRAAATPDSPGNDNDNENDSGKTQLEPPTDPDRVQSDLTDIENEWTAANLNADKKKLDRILADDYVAILPNGAVQGKADYLRDIQPDSTIKRWEFENLKVTLTGDRASLQGAVRYVRDQAADQLWRFTDKFVWRDGRWQAVGSEISQVQ